MSFQEVLIGAGFDRESAVRLVDDERFRQRNANKSSEEILQRIDQIAAVYNTDADHVIKAVSKFPAFVGYDHERVIGGIMDVYGWSKEEAGKAVSKFPRFAGYDHERVVRQLCRIGRMVGLDEDTVKEKILKKPMLAGYSAKRYIAAVDVVRHLRTENALDDDTTIKMCLDNYPSMSPYVPDTDKLRITQALRKGGYNEEPPLMKALRKSIRNQKVKAGRVKQRA